MISYRWWYFEIYLDCLKSYWCYDGSNDFYLVHIKEPIGHVANGLQISCLENRCKNKTELHRGYSTRYREDNVWIGLANCLCVHKKVTPCLFPGWQSKSGNKHENSRRMSAQSFRQDGTYIIQCVTGHGEPINDDEKTVFTHRHRASLGPLTLC